MIQIQGRCAATDMRACYAMMLGFPERLPLDWHAAHVQAADISWMSVNSSKPGRTSSVVVHSTNAWANENLDMPIDDVQQHLLESSSRYREWTRRSRLRTVHRWRYANVPQQDGEPCYVDAEHAWVRAGLVVRGRIEAAFTSAKLSCTAFGTCSRSARRRVGLDVGLEVLNNIGIRDFSLK